MRKAQINASTGKLNPGAAIVFDERRLANAPDVSHGWCDILFIHSEIERERERKISELQSYDISAACCIFISSMSLRHQNIIQC